MLALGFLALFGLMMPSLLQLGSTNLLGTARLREQRSAVYAADGATDGAIQYLRAHDLCGRPGIGSCPISQFTSTVNGVTATTTWAFSGLPIHYDRTFDLTTTVAGAPRVTAKVIIRDSNVTSVEKPVDVLNWTYKR
jgi:hypothetical protein